MTKGVGVVEHCTIDDPGWYLSLSLNFFIKKSFQNLAQLWVKCLAANLLGSDVWNTPIKGYNLPHCNYLYTTDTEWAHCKYNNYREIESESKTPSRESNLRPCAPQARFDAALASSNSSGLILPASGAQVQWLSSRTYVQVVTVAFWCLEVFQTAPCTSYPSKQQRPTAWFTALRYQCPLLKGILSYSVSQQSMIWVLKKYFILTLTRRELKNWILKNLRASGETKSSFTADR